MKKYIFSLILGLCATCTISAQDILKDANYEFTNYAEVQDSKFRMWVPPTSQKVKGVVVTFTQMQEVVSLDANLRKACLLEDLAIVWASSLGENDYSKLEAGLTALAEVSGMEEIATVPFATIAHSTAGIFCRTIATANPERCFAVVQLSAVDYRDNDKLADVPWLTIKNGSEETGDTWEQARYFIVNDKEAYKNPDGSDSGDDKAWKSPRGNGCRMSMISVPGGGHFGWSPMEAKLVAKFIEKAAHYQLSEESTAIKRIPENEGWLTDTAFISKPAYEAAQYNDYKGEPSKAFWHIDQEMATMWTEMHAEELAKTPQKVTQSTFDSGVWATSSRRLDINNGGLDTPYPHDATSSVASNPIKIKLYNAIYRIVDGKDLYYSPARYGFNGSKDWITFYQEGTDTERYAEVTTGQVQATGFPQGSDFSITAIEDKNINDGGVAYNVTSEANIDNWIVSGNVYLSDNEWKIDNFTSVPKAQVYIRHAAGDYKAVKETTFTITNERTAQVVTFNSTIPETVTSGAPATINLNATSTGKDATIKYYVVSGPATVEGDVLTTTGEEGSITILAIASNQENNPAKAILSIEVNQSDAVIENLAENNIKVYPTITEDIVNVCNVPQSSTITITDLGGRVVLNTYATGKNTQVSLSELSAGMYLLSVEGCSITKIIRK